MQKKLKGLGRRIINWLEPRCIQYQDETVTSLVLGTAQLELSKNESVNFAPVGGSWGPITLTGNCLPVFSYTCFEKTIMEFIRVTVEVSKPDRIKFTATIDSVTAPELHGKQVEVTDAYKKPFFKLALYLTKYFPFTRYEPGVASDRPKVLKAHEAFEIKGEVSA